MSAVGRMDGAFFVSRTELLHWVNSTFDVNLQKVEQCANGAAYCQIIDACHPGMVAMRKVNWNARDEHQCIPNYKVLQQAFDKVGLQKHIEVDKLVRGKYQDNLEMLQWIKTYHDRTAPGDCYDPWPRRFGDLPEWARAGVSSGSRCDPPSRPGSAASGNLRRETPGGGRPTRPTPARGSPGSAQRNGVGSPASFKSGQLKEEYDKLRDEVVDLKITVDGLETERDFYFQKLRDIEILCQAFEARPDPNMAVDQFVENVQRILYAKDDDDEDYLGPESDMPS